MQTLKQNRGGFREGAGRPKTEGTRHTWVVPEDVEAIAREKGIAYLWDAVRFKARFDSLQV